MALIEKSVILAKLIPKFHHELAEKLVDEFISIEKRFILRDWEPTELDGGQFAEILARAVYQVDSGTLNLAKDFGSCVEYIESDKGAPHAITPRHDAIHIARVLRTIYKFRSQRGAVHIPPPYGRKNRS